MRSISKPSSYSYFELLDACKERGCPICRLGNASAQRHLRHLIYDGVNDIPTRAVLRDSYGYCHEHAWMLPESGESAPLGIAIIHRDILNSLYARLAEEAFGPQRGAGLRAMLSGGSKPDLSNDAGSARYLPSKARCPACVQRGEAEQLALASLLEALDKEDEAMAVTLRDSEGICLPHLRAAMDQALKARTFESLVEITRAQLAELIHDLDEFVRKNDHRFREEKISAQEAESWRKAVQRVAGNQ